MQQCDHPLRVVGFCGSTQAVELFLHGIPADLGPLLDENFRIFRPVEVFVGDQQLFIKLFAGTQADLLNFDVHAGRQPGQADHLLRQLADIHRLAHVQHEHLAAAREGAGLQHELDGLGDGHEVAHDAPVGDGNRPAVGDLLFK